MIKQDLLYSESQKYIALTAEEADKVARRIAFRRRLGTNRPVLLAVP